ncbi:MAG TPA: hypothetical protein VJG32_10110 [Anaerolineae bacterium]|nr:hypothetical protein [Anaerolineae bacterium]
MFRLRKYAGVAVLIAVVAALGISSAAFAQEATPAAPAAPFAHSGFGRGLGSQAALEAAAEALGMTADELSTQLWGGKTLAEIADEAGVELQVVRDAVEAAQLEASRADIAQAVEDGRITQAQADWLLEGLDNGYWGGHGFGRGGFPSGRPFGFGGAGFSGRSGFRGFDAPNSDSVSPNTRNG